MVKKLCILSALLCVFVAGSAWAEMRFSLKADKKSITLGEPLSLELKAEDAVAPLSSVDLTPLKKNFNVYSMSSGMQTQKRKGRIISNETMTLIVYPLSSGKLSLPALSYMKKLSKPLLITVTESGAQTSRVLFKTAVDTVQAYVRQASTLTLDIYDDGTLQWSAPRELILPGAHQRKLAESQYEEMLEGTRYTVHRYAWAVMPLREGTLTAEFPIMEAFKFGTRLRYPVAPLKVEVAPVPVYLPVHVPIGKVRVTAEALPAEIAVDAPVNLQLKIEGAAISDEGLLKLLGNLKSHETLHIYAPVISRAENVRPTSAVQTLQVTIPFVPLKTGTLVLPEVNLPYYNPELARVESAIVAEIKTEVFNPLWLTLQKVLLGLLLSVGILAAGYFLFVKITHAVNLRKSLRKIAAARNAAELHQALLEFELRNKLQAVMTLQQWLEYMRQKYHVDAQLSVVVQRLQLACYGESGQAVDIEHLARDAAQCLKHCKRKDSAARAMFARFRASALLQ